MLTQALLNTLVIFVTTIQAIRFSEPHLHRRDGLQTFKCDGNEIGKIHCVDQSHFVLCFDGDIPVQSTAAGTYCDTTSHQIMPALRQRDELATYKCTDLADLGKLHCVDQSHFVICVDGNAPVQPLAAGTYCDLPSNKILPLDQTPQPKQEHSHLGPQVPPS